MLRNSARTLMLLNVMKHCGLGLGVVFEEIIAGKKIKIHVSK